ncbi:hypothetical protein D3C71_1911220 [compost metagenome]
MGRLAQLVDHHHGVRLLIEIPQTLVAIRARLLEEQSLHKVVVERQRETIAVIFLRVGHASIERCGRFAGEGRGRVEPGQHPGVKVAPGHSPRANPAGLQ